MLQRLHPELKAYRLRFEPVCLQELQGLFQQQLAPYLAAHPQLLAGEYYQSEVLQPQQFYLVSYDTYPLLWLTNHSQATYAPFARLFRALQLDHLLADVLDFEKQLVMYSGFFVVGNRATERMWHYDYRPGAQAMTLITPLFDWNPAHGHLLYQLPDGQEQLYTYQLGEAIVFGDGFLHSTQPYAQTEPLRVLVSFTFGSDKWQHWPVIKQNIAEQSYFYCQPCGHPVNSCSCEQGWQQRQRFWRWLRPGK